MRNFVLVGLLAMLVGCGNGVMDSQVSTNESLSRTTDQTIVRDYFPMVTGMTWSFGDQASPIGIGRSIRTNAGEAYILEGLLQERVIRSTDDNKVLELKGDTWRLLFDFGASEKTTWTLTNSEDGSDLLDGSTFEVVSRTEAVSVPYGRYAESIHLRIRPRNGLYDAGLTDMWFVPNIGLVKWSTMWIGGVRTHELLELASYGPSVPKETDTNSGSFIGRILEITPGTLADLDKGILGSVLVDGGKGTGQGMDRARITLRDDTMILAQDGTSRQEVVFSALTVGQKVEGTISGPVKESYPVQATASGIMILSE